MNYHNAILDSLSCLKASKAETQGVKKSLPFPTITLPVMLKANHKPNNAGKAINIATLRGASNLLVMQLLTLCQTSQKKKKSNLDST